MIKKKVKIGTDEWFWNWCIILILWFLIMKIQVHDLLINMKTTFFTVNDEVLS